MVVPSYEARLGLHAYDLDADGHDTVSSGGGGFVPTFIDAAETFTVPANRQALFAMTIDNEGTLVVDGYLIEVA